jgi:hypothetical protein
MPPLSTWPRTKAIDLGLENNKYQAKTRPVLKCRADRSSNSQESPDMGSYTPHVLAVTWLISGIAHDWARTQASPITRLSRAASTTAFVTS